MIRAFAAMRADGLDVPRLPPDGCTGEKPYPRQGPSSGSPADIALARLSPVALRPRLSTGLPFSLDHRPRLLDGNRKCGQGRRRPRDTHADL